MKVNSIHLGVLVFIILLGLAGYAFSRQSNWLNLSKKNILIGLGIKGTFSVVFILIFTYYYGNGHLSGDAHEFLKDGAVLNQLAFSNPGEYFKLLFGFGELDPTVFRDTLEQTNIWTTSNNGDLINDNRLIIRINSVIHFFSFNSPYVHALVFSILSFYGVLLIYKSISDLVQRKELFFYVLLGFPSLAFWSSGISKEGILVFAVGLFVFVLRRWKQNPGIYSLLFVFSVFLLSWNKPYVGLVLLATSLIFLIFKIETLRKRGILIFGILATMGFTFLCYAPSSINLVEKISYKQKDLINLGRGGVFFVTDSSFCAFDFKNYQNFRIYEDSVEVVKPTEGEYKLFGESEFYNFQIEKGPEKYAKYLVQPPSNSFYESKRINYSIENLIISIPFAIHTVLIRPYPWDNGSALKHFAFISNLILIVLFGISLARRRTLGIEEKYWLYYLLFSSLFITLIIGWTVPILGAVVRYKMAVDLLLIISIFILWKKESNSIS